MSSRSDIAFTPAVKQAQTERGSRQGYERAIGRRDWAQEIDAGLAAFIAERDSLYLGTASADGQPTIQHRGGPPGFVKVIDDTTLAFGDYAGNQQYISLGNLSENPKAFIFFMDYPNRRRIKVWGRARFVEDDAELLARVSDADAEVPERVLVFEIEAWDRNCPKHITPRFTAREIEAAAARRR